MLQLKRFLCFAVLLCAVALAQVDRAALTGTVTDASGAAIAGAVVSVSSPSTGFRREAMTSDAGVYQLPGLPVGAYSITVSRAGFGSVKADNVLVTVGQTRTLDFELPVESISTAVEVSAQVTPLEQTNAEIGSVINEKQMRNIPLNGRHWAALMMLAPGAVNVGEGNQNSIRFFGRPRDDNNWTFDGVDATGIKCRSNVRSSYESKVESS